MLRRAATATATALLVLAVGCGGGSTGGASPGAAGPSTITVGTDRVPVAGLVGASAGLCQARDASTSNPAEARAAFYDRAHDAIHTVARALEPVDRAMAAQLLEAKEKVEAELDAKPPAPVRDDLGRLADAYRAGLGRLAIAVPPCVE